MSFKSYGVSFLFLIILIIILYPLAKIEYKGCCGCSESFQNKKTKLTYSDKIFENNYLLQNYYPKDTTVIIDSNNYSNNWVNYPIFSLGSYEQITNNLKYVKSPDDGTCTPAELCGEFYKKKDYYPNTNVSLPLPPVPNEKGIRINYYKTPINLFLSDQSGPLVDLPAFQ